MEKTEEKKIKNTEEFNEDDWESISEKDKTEETKDILYRLNFEQASKVKLDFSKLKNYHSIKVKKLIQKEIESFYELDQYIKKEYIPNMTVTHNNNSNPYITILNNDYVLKKHPEVGTYLIYEMDDKNQEANLIGKSDTWYEATIFKPKMRIRKPAAHPKNENIHKISKNINLNKKTDVVKKNENFEKNGNNRNLLLNKKRKRKKKKRIYLKDSTVIEIKRIFDNKEKEKEKEKEEDKNNQNNNDNNKINEDEEKEKKK